MIKEYRKTATIKAEQFDGSKEMIKKYNLGFWKGQDTGEVYEYSIPTKEGVLDLNVGDWIATGVEGENWAIDDEIFKKTYEEVKNDQGDMQYVHLSDVNAKDAYIDTPPSKMRDTEQAKYIYLVQENNRSWDSLFTWGYFSNVKEAIETVERLRDVSDNSEFHDTVELVIKRAPFNVSELDSDWDDKTHKLYVLYEEASDVDGHLIRNQSDWDALLKD